MISILTFNNKVRMKSVFFWEQILEWKNRWFCGDEINYNYFCISIYIDIIYGAGILYALCVEHYKKHLRRYRHREAGFNASIFISVFHLEGVISHLVSLAPVKTHESSTCLFKWMTTGNPYSAILLTSVFLVCLLCSILFCFVCLFVIWL